MTISETLVASAPPLHEDRDGVVRVARTRVTLDTVLVAYLSGMIAEEIASDFDVLTPADVHSVLAYYLRNREAVDEYLAARGKEAQEIRAQIEAKSSWKEFRAKLLARRASQETGHG
jgi:uncharacterized protein (DUF433 family)